MLTYGKLEDDDNRLVTGSGRWDEGWEVRDGKALVGVLLVNWGYMHNGVNEGDWRFAAEPEFMHCLGGNLIDSSEYRSLEYAKKALEKAFKQAQVIA